MLLKIKYLYFCSLPQHMRSGSDLSSRSGNSALLRSWDLSCTSLVCSQTASLRGAITRRGQGQHWARQWPDPSLGLELLFA